MLDRRLVICDLRDFCAGGADLAFDLVCEFGDTPLGLPDV